MRSGTDGDETRTMMMAVCARLGHTNIIELADVEPDAVIELWEAVELMNENSYDNVTRRARETKA
jgi:hypothetical protein